MILLCVAIGLFGLLIGSFLNVVIYRVPLHKSVVSPRSSCPHCGTEIRARDNVPVLSWILLRGKCRNCKAPISARYPLVELGTGVVFFAVAWLFSGALIDAVTLPAVAASVLVLIAYLYLAAISIALTFIDIDTRKLPNTIVLPAYGIGAGLLLASSVLSRNYGALLVAGIGAAGLFGIYFVLALIYPGGMGFGDVKLAGVLGLFLGWLGWGVLFVGAFAPFLFGGIYGIVLMIIRRAGRKTRISFGPWMFAGTWAGIVVGSEISNWYLGLFGLA